MNILISGIHGFVGSNLVQAFGRKHRIFGLDILAPEKEGVIRTYNWNQLDEIPEVDVVIHLAGKAHDTKNQSEADVYFKVNTELTKTLYDWFLHSNASKFLFFSTVKAAADSVGDAVLTEDVEPTPKGPYGESKARAEQYLLTHMNSYAENQSPETRKLTYILRPSMIHGPGNKGNLNLLYQLIRKRLPWPLGAFENKRSFTSVDNLIFLLDRLIVSDAPAGIYNIADDETLSTNELIRLIGSSLGYPVKILNINSNIIVKFSVVGTRLRLPLNTARLSKLTENYVVSNDKIKHVLNIDKLPCSAADGIVKTIKSFSL